MPIGITIRRTMIELTKNSQLLSVVIMVKKNKNFQKTPTTIDRNSLFLLGIASGSKYVAYGIKSTNVSYDNFTVVNFENVTRLAAGVTENERCRIRKHLNIWLVK